MFSRVFSISTCKEMIEVKWVLGKMEIGNGVFSSIKY